jgi:predicted ester cyclase
MRHSIETVKAGHQAYNSGDYKKAAELALSPDTPYVDHSNGKTLNRSEFADWLAGHKNMASDMRIADPQYVGDGNLVVAQFTARGINDGSVGGFDPTGQEIAIDICEIYRIDDDGQVVSVDHYSDNLKMMIQVGNIDPPGE